MFNQWLVILFFRQEDYVCLQAASPPTWIRVSTTLSWWASSLICWLYYLIYLLYPDSRFSALLTLQKFSIQSAWFVKNLYSSSAACLVIPIFFSKSRVRRKQETETTSAFLGAFSRERADSHAAGELNDSVALSPQSHRSLFGLICKSGYVTQIVL